MRATHRIGLAARAPSASYERLQRERIPCVDLTGSFLVVQAARNAATTHRVASSTSHRSWVGRPQFQFGKKMFLNQI